MTGMYLKPIFHCDAKPFALGTGVGLDPRRHPFASRNAKYTNMLVYFAVSEIKGAPCTRGARFDLRVHGFVAPCTRKCMAFLNI